MYFTSCIGDAIRIQLRLTLFVVSLVLLQPPRRTTPELLQRWNPPSQRSSSSGSISRRLRSSSPPPTAKSAGASSPANPITLRSTWLRQRGCTLVASLFYSTCYIYIVHWAHGFVPLVSPWKKKRRNFNFHLSSFSNSYSWSTRLRDSSIIAL